MKKYLVAVGALLCAGSLAFAQVVTEPKVDVEGDGTLSWGIDLGAKGSKATHGFKNEASWTVKFPIIKKTDYTAKSDTNPVYGELKIKKVELGLKSTEADKGAFKVDGKVGGLEATFYFFGGYITVYDKPSFEADKADDLLKGFSFAHSFDGAGTKIGFKADDLLATGVDLDLGFKFGSNGAWDETKNSKYGFGFDAQVGYTANDLKYVDVDFTVNSTFSKVVDYDAGIANNLQDKVALNFGVGVSSTPIKDLTIKLGFDAAPFYAVKHFAWEFSSSVKYRWVKVALGLDNVNSGDKVDLGVYAEAVTKAKASDSTNLVPGLDAGVRLGSLKILTEKKKALFFLDMWASYKYEFDDVMWIKPYGRFYGEKAVAGKFGMYYNIGLTFAPIERVELTADWSQGVVSDKAFPKFDWNGGAAHYLQTPAGSDHRGKFVLSCKVSY